MLQKTKTASPLRLVSMNRYTLRAAGIGTIASIGVLAMFSILTAIIANPFFRRMMPVRWYDYVFLLTTSVLLGVYIGLSYYVKKTRTSCDYTAAGGTLAGLFSFGCAMCNHLLVAIFGFTGVMTYFYPLQPVLGMLSIIVLVAALYMKKKEIPRRQGAKR